MIPLSEWEVRFTGGEASNEIFFTRLDGAFDGVADMVVWGYVLK